jgi:hypothetical protein
MWAGRWIRQPHGGKGKMIRDGNFLASTQIPKKEPRKSQNNTKQEALEVFYGFSKMLKQARHEIPHLS